MHGRVAVIGYGPAGMGLVEGLVRGGYDPEKITVFAGDRSYSKPCGEAVLSERLAYLSPKPPITNRVVRFHIGLLGGKVWLHTFNEPHWVIIDKKRWLGLGMKRHYGMGVSFEYIRVRPEKAFGMGFDVVFDARGPFTTSALEKIPVYNIIGDYGVWGRDRVAILMDPFKIGFFWLFPSGDSMVNLGYGSLRGHAGYDDVLVIAEKMFGIRKMAIVKKRAAPVTIGGLDRSPYSGKLGRVGEAAGYVYPLTGEGIAPSYIHGYHIGLFYAKENSLEKAYSLAEKTEPLKTVRKGIEFQRMLLEKVRLMPPNVRFKAMSCLGSSSYRSLLSEKIGYRTLLSTMLKCPFLIKYL